MQPNHDDDTWQKPSEQPPQAPYAVPSDTPEEKQPVVSLTTDVEQPLLEEDADEELTLPTEPVRWQAKEYVHYEKHVSWFVIFGLVVLALMAGAIFLLDSLSFAILIPVMAAALIVYLNRPPRTLEYTVGSKGLYINDHLYNFSEFKGFGVIHDDGEYSIMLIPTKRFRPGVVVYFPEESGEAIVDMLGMRLPMQELKPDLIDKIVRKLRI
jgi:hypothetical protein